MWFGNETYQHHPQPSMHRQQVHQPCITRSLPPAFFFIHSLSSSSSSLPLVHRPSVIFSFNTLYLPPKYKNKKEQKTTSCESGQRNNNRTTTETRMRQVARASFRCPFPLATQSVYVSLHSHTQTINKSIDHGVCCLPPSFNQLPQSPTLSKSHKARVDNAKHR